MRSCEKAFGRLIPVVLLLWMVASAGGAEVTLVERKHDPYGSPRPHRGQKNVPAATSFYIELSVEGSESPDTVAPDSVGIRLRPETGPAIDVLEPGQEFAAGYFGRLFAKRTRQGKKPALAVYVDSQSKLRPDTTYTIRVSAKSRRGAELPAKGSSWKFTTEAAPAVHPVSFELDLLTPPVRWHGAFFSGFCKPSFCTSRSNRIEGYELMDRVFARNPKAWGLQRDISMTGMEHQPRFLSQMASNAVRERETRRITAIETGPDAVVLHVEDFFGHQQYGIPSGRPLGEDYHPGDEVLIADGVDHARTKVLAVNDAEMTVSVSPFDGPEGRWKIEYSAPLPFAEDPNSPGLFPPGGCYLRKFKPHGTPCYYWGRLDTEWDLVHGRFGRRLIVNFVDAPGDLAIDGRNWTTAKDYAQLHQVTREMTDHLIERYGDACLKFPWSVFNEPDLARVFFRTDWTELQKFYDYTVDAILRSFEDHGYDSDRVFVGGLELGAIFGTHLKLAEFLAHCSPKAEAKGALELNAAFADSRLDGKRSNRVERLCRANNGRGSPCDFISIHSYNTSELMAAKLARAKEMALEADPEFFGDLWINSHESCPDWAPPPDPAAADSYLGNGYFPTWCADVARRQLQRAADDAAYAFGETILTFWPWPNSNFSGANAATRVINVDDDGDGRKDRTVTIPMPIFHFIDLLSGMSDDYWVLPEKVIGGHVISGFASRAENEIRVLLYTHHSLDTQARSEAEFDYTLTLRGVKWPDVGVEEYRFDKDHNSYFHLGRRLRDDLSADGLPPAQSESPEVAKKLATAVEALTGTDVEAQLAGLKTLAELGPAAHTAAEAIFSLTAITNDKAVRLAAQKTLAGLLAPKCYSAEQVAEVERLAELRVTGESDRRTSPDESVQLTVRVSGGGVNFLVMEPR